MQLSHSLKVRSSGTSALVVSPSEQAARYTDSTAPNMPLMTKGGRMHKEGAVPKAYCTAKASNALYPNRTTDFPRQLPGSALRHPLVIRVDPQEIA